MPRLIGKDCQLLSVQPLDINGTNVGTAYDWLADFEDVKASFQRKAIDVSATKDDFESYRATHIMGTVTLSGFQRSASTAARSFGTSANGIVQWQTSASGDNYQIPVFIEKFDLNNGKDAAKETLEMKIAGPILLNGTPLSI